MAAPQSTVNSLFANTGRERQNTRASPITRPQRFGATRSALSGQASAGIGQLTGVRRAIPVLSQPENAPVIGKKERDEILTEAAKREAELPLLTIVRSAISLYSWEEMQRIAGPIRVTNLNLQGNGSVNDPRMGVVSLNVSCQYCSQIDCPGHFGVIEFRAPIYNPAFIREIVSVLTCVCNDCGGLLITEDVMRQQGFLRLSYDKRLAAMEAYCKQMGKCLRETPVVAGGAVVPCASNPTFDPGDIKEKGEITYRVPQNGTKRATKDDPTYIMPIETVISILDRISPEDANLLGFPRGSHHRRMSRTFILNILVRVPADDLVRNGFPRGVDVRDIPYETVLDILDKVPDSVLKDFGFPQGSHPRNMIMRGILVPPVIARPPVYEGGSIHHDQLTHMYIIIMRRAIDVAQGKQGAVHELYSTVKQLIFKTEGKKMGMRDFLSVVERIQGKAALLRGLLMGKRVNYCGRTVAGPDATLKYGQVRIPASWAPVLTKKVKVTNFNIQNLTALLEERKITHITSLRDGLRKLYNPRHPYVLRIGDQVERWLQNGDRIVVNRQPTLHRQSMMSYEVVLGHELTVGLHLSYTAPMNCDFDGDENNGWNPQDFEVEAECELLLNVKENVMSAEQNRPIMGLVMNSVSGAYLLTTPDTINPKAVVRAEDLLNLDTGENSDMISRLVDKYTGSNLATLMDSVKDPSEFSMLYSLAVSIDAVTPGTRIDDDLFAELLTLITDQRPIETLYQRLVKYGVHPRSGQAMFSAMLPEDFYYNHKGVLIVEGVLVSGRLRKSHVGASHRSIIQELWKNYGSKRTADFFTDAPWVINKWLIERGFSVGILDTINLAVDENTGAEYDKNKRILEQELAKIYVQLEALGGKSPDATEEAFRQRQINNLVNIAGGIGLRLAKEVLSGDNSIGVMTDQGAGTKGGIANIGQMMGSVGQQFYRGERLKATLTGGTRLLPTYDENDNNPEAHGFIPVSFFTGLSPEGLFFLQAGGREGLLDTALKTAETGAMQHRMIKAFENIIIGYDGSIRNTIGTMFSPMYNSGYDIAEMMAVETKGKPELSSFIDLKSTIADLNIQRGWVPSSVDNTVSKHRASLAHSDLPAENILPVPPENYFKGPPLTDTSASYDITTPVPRQHATIRLTKFEKSRIIGTRSTQLSNNAPPLIDIGAELDPVKIALMEYEAGILPLYIVRKFADGTHQIVRPTLDNI